MQATKESESGKIFIKQNSEKESYPDKNKKEEDYSNSNQISPLHEHMEETEKIKGIYELKYKLSNIGKNITEFTISISDDETKIWEEFTKSMEDSLKGKFLKPLNYKKEETGNQKYIILEYEGKLSKFIDNDLNLDKSKNIRESRVSNSNSNSNQRSYSEPKMNILKKIADIVLSLPQYLCDYRISEDNFIINEIDEKQDIKIGLIPNYNFKLDNILIKDKGKEKLTSLERGFYIANLWISLFSYLIGGNELKEKICGNPNYLNDDFEKEFSQILESHYKIFLNFLNYDMDSLFMYTSSIRIVMYRNKGIEKIINIIQNIFESNIYNLATAFPIIYPLKLVETSENIQNTIDKLLKKYIPIHESKTITSLSLFLEKIYKKISSQLEEIKSYASTLFTINPKLSLKENIENHINHLLNQIQNIRNTTIEEEQRRQEINNKNYENEINTYKDIKTSLENNIKNIESQFLKELGGMKSIKQELEKEKLELSKNYSQLNDWKTKIMDPIPIDSSKNYNQKQFIEEIAKLHYQVVQNNFQIEKLNNEMQCKIKQENDSIKKMEEEQQKHAKLTEIIQIKIHEIKHLENYIEKLETLLTEERQRIRINNSPKEFNQDEIKKFKNEIEGKYVDIISRLKEMLQKESQDKIATFSLMKSEIEKLNLTIQSDQEKYSANMKSLIDTKSDLEKQLNGKISRLEKELGENICEKNKLSDHNILLQKEIAIQDARITFIKRIIKEEKGKIQNEQDVWKKAFKEDYKVLAEAKKDLLQKNQDLEVINNKLESEVFSQKEKLLSKEIELKKFREETNNNTKIHNEQYHLFIKSKEEAEYYYQELKNQFGSLKQEKDKLNQEMANFQELNYNLKDELNNKNKILLILQNDLNNASKSNEDLINEVKQNQIGFKKEISNKEEENKKLREFWKRYSRIENQIASYYKLVSSKDKEIENLNSKIKSDNLEYKSKLTEMEISEAQDKSIVAQMLQDLKKEKDENHNSLINLGVLSEIYNECISRNLREDNI